MWYTLQAMELHIYIHTYTHIYIFVSLIWCSATGKCIYTHIGTKKLLWTQRGSNSLPPDWGNTASCQLSGMFASGHWNCVKNHNPNDMPKAALDNWQPIWNAQVSISYEWKMLITFKYSSNFSWYRHLVDIAFLKTELKTITCLDVPFEEHSRSQDEKKN